MYIRKQWNCPIAVKFRFSNGDISIHRCSLRGHARLSLTRHVTSWRQHNALFSAATIVLVFISGKTMDLLLGPATQRGRRETGLLVLLSNVKHRHRKGNRPLPPLLKSSKNTQMCSQQQETFAVTVRHCRTPWRSWRVRLNAQHFFGSFRNWHLY